MTQLNTITKHDFNTLTQSSFTGVARTMLMRHILGNLDQLLYANSVNEATHQTLMGERANLVLVCF